MVKAAIIGVGLAGLLAGCEAGVSGGSGTARSAKSVPARMVVAGGALVIAGPVGYCVDTTASHDGAGGAFVLLGSCASLSGSAANRKPANPAILTASVFAGSGDDAAFAASFPAMAKFLSSSAGRQALSRSGQAQSVAIAQITSADDVMYIRASDRAAATGQDVEAEYWRALMSVKGQIVTLSVLGLRDMPLNTQVKRQLLEAFVAKVRATNRG